MAGAVLVVGATGILAPAAAILRAEGESVVGVSRSGADGTVAVDARDGEALDAALGNARWERAVVYLPAVSTPSLALVRRRTPGRLVIVRTSGDADPARGILIVPRDTLQLGWSAEPPHRWHTPQEVSRAALRVLGDGEPRTLGAVRPWSDRP